ncbi:phosphatidylserine decarboxylase [Denitratisoma oestradiolicum]|uniref:Phosphatidylserine decarboxylase proenzyme n=1 Tax=Denitratisoma oestradiolicum TaxID=311182 RepID=A0A6S6XWZ5_9PROT|nr:phosphatidylserine decarboxylase [Denitratisoma oestradiolicum]TWO81427.1 phosphatidylserine decarboxylase [Denitratisoma oestradiolicum]CAB1368627.1 Phosphatidylserine decarboxylase proenzyme [Denitratisoma oestradiolicum]
MSQQQSHSYPHPLIAREGWPFLAIALVLALGATWFDGWLLAVPLWLIFIFVLQFFRDPPRQIPGDGKSVLSPADGRIVAIEPARDPWLERDCLKVSVFMNVFNVHSNRSPVDGVVVQRWYHPGAFVNAALDKASVENERNALHIRTSTGLDITCVQVAGLIARRILCYVEAGATLARGQRYGFIRFGSRVDLYLPTDVRVRVTIGEKVRATSTILADLP